MSEDIDEVVDNFKQGSTWLRILLMLGFAVVLYVVGVVILFLTVAQALFSIVTGHDNRNLRMLGASVSEYVSQVLRFITYNTEERPFPFAPFPDADKNSAQEPDLTSGQDAKQETATKKKSAAKEAKEAKEKASTEKSSKIDSGKQADSAAAQDSKKKADGNDADPDAA